MMLVRAGIRELVEETLLVLLRPDALFEEIAGGRRMARHVRALAALSVAFSAPFGMATGAYAGRWQALITGAKVPVLLLASLALCAPLLCMVAPILGLRVSFLQSLSTALLSVAVTALALGSLSPAVFLFSRTLTLWNHHHYLFLLLLLLASCAASGAVSLACLWRSLDRIGAGGRRLRIFVAWVLLYQFVGSQVAWMLRPFVGRSQDAVRFAGNFYEYLPVLFSGFFRGLQ